MYRSSFALVGAIAALAISGSVASADESSSAPGDSHLTASPNNWYLSGSAGLSFLEQQRNKSGTINFDSTGSNPGFDVTGALGKRLSDGFRVEGEIGYRQINLAHGTVYTPGATGISSGAVGGDASALSFMGNGYYDFDTGGPIKPYIGAGLGFARVAMSDVSVNGRSVVDDDDLGFAYQAMAGIGYQVTPAGTVFTGYRYFAVNDPTFTDSAGEKFRSEFASHNLEVGYRLSF